MKLVFLFMTVSLLTLSDLYAKPYNCYLPGIATPVGTVPGLGKADPTTIKNACNIKHAQCGGACTGLPPAPLRK